MTHIARDPGGYVLPICDQPWFDGIWTPKEAVRVWEQANREDWIRFDGLRQEEREAEARSAAKWRTSLVICWFLLVILLVMFR